MRKLFVTFMLVLCLSACGGGGGDSTPQTTSDTTPRITCAAPEILNDAGDACVTPESISCTAPEILNDAGDTCILPDPTEGFFSTEPDIVFDNVEGQRKLAFCPYGYRDDVRVFDFNQDGHPDILSAFRCIPESWPEPNTVHNAHHQSAWVIWLAQDDGAFVESTETLAGQNYVDITDGKTGGIPAGVGGLKRQDINRDGYPDIWYHMNRDDTRLPDDDGIYDTNPLYTWQSQQSVFMSNPDGTYKVQFIGEPLYAGTAAMIGTPSNSFDFLILGYGEASVHRFIDGSWLDVYDEWANKPIWDPLSNGSVYLNFINLDVPDNDPLTASAPTASLLVQDGTNSDFVATQENGLTPAGVTIYDFSNSQGEYLGSWAYDSPQVVYKQPCKYCEERFNNAAGFEWGGENTFGMAWETQLSVRLFKDEAPVLILHALGFAQKNAYKDETFDPNSLYGTSSEDLNLPESQQIIPAHLLKVLRVENGEVIDRDINPIDENIIRDSSYFYKFVDLNNDGYDDMFIQTYSQSNPIVYLNNQQGKFKRITDKVFPSSSISSGSVSLPSGNSLNLGSSGALRDVNGDGLYDLVVWHLGWKPYVGNTVTEEQKWQTGKIEIYYAKKPLTLENLAMTSEEIFELEASRGY